MKVLTRLGSAGAKVTAGLGAAVTAGALLATAGGALAGPARAAANTGAGTHNGSAAGAVFVQTDNTAGNQVVAYDRAGNGQLTLAGTYNTGGLGGPLSGAGGGHPASP